jgi:fumarate reductase flavoprotein subunit
MPLRYGETLPIESSITSPIEHSETIAADVVVIGAGLSGLCAALSARELGVSVAVIEKGKTSCSNGMAQAAIGSQIQRECGVVVDRHEVVAELLLASGHRADERLLHLWANESGSCMDWLVGLARSKGLRPTVAERSMKYLGKTKLFPTGVFFGGNAALLNCLQEIAVSRGIDIRYDTRAFKLNRDGNGRVTGVFSRAADNDITLWRSTKATILCSGGFENSAEMMSELFPARDIQAIRAWEQPFPTATGDGLRMVVSIGGALQSAPHALMNGPGALPNGKIFDVAMLPWLLVNSRGERFVQEATPYLGEALLTQPGGFAWTVLDSNWIKVLKSKDVVQTADQEKSKLESMSEHIACNAVLQAESVEELAEALPCDFRVLDATLTRYNEICRLGYDDDFGKPADWLHPVEKPPFYAVNNGVRGLVTLSGAHVNTSLQVLDTSGRVIPGLYAAGSASGDFFSGTYPRNVLGISNGRAFTFGRLAGIRAASESD